ncbi:MAG: GFA family protein [Patescibacteria group bacterium]
MTTYTGGCHCGLVRYEATSTLDKVISCNCSHCQIKGLLLNFIPSADFKLLSGEDSLTLYQFNKKKIDHLFCTVCGVESFARGKDNDGNEMTSLNVRCLDDIDLESLTITPFNGKDW